MNSDQFDAALQAFCRRHPFRPILIEFTSGAQIQIRHPEVIRRDGILYLLRFPDHGFAGFAAESVCRLLDMLNPMPPQA